MVVTGMSPDSTFMGSSVVPRGRSPDSMLAIEDDLPLVRLRIPRSRGQSVPPTEVLNNMLNNLGGILVTYMLPFIALPARVHLERTAPVWKEQVRPTMPPPRDTTLMDTMVLEIDLNLRPLPAWVEVGVVVLHHLTLTDMYRLQLCDVDMHNYVHMSEYGLSGPFCRRRYIRAPLHAIQDTRGGH